MVKDRLSLHSLLLTMAPYVYFQPPSTLKMNYPCIIYKLAEIEQIHANDKKYLNMKRYLLTVVDEDPDTIIHEKVLEVMYSSFETHFVADNLNHYVCSLYY